jgi:hypothetical protein
MISRKFCGNDIREVEVALRATTRKGFDLQRYGAMWELVESYFYIGDYVRARNCVLADWDATSKSLFDRVWRILLVTNLIMRGRTALACWLDNPKDSILRAEVEDDATRLKRIHSHWGDPMSKVLKAGLAAGDGRMRLATVFGPFRRFNLAHPKLLILRGGGIGLSFI